MVKVIRYVFIVEDNAGVLACAIKYFTNCGYRTEGVSCIRDAYPRIMDSKPDIVLTDYELPDGTGVALAKQIREAGHEGPIFLWSGSNEEEIRADNGGDLGEYFSGFFPKPPDWNDVLDAFDSCF